MRGMVKFSFYSWFRIQNDILSPLARQRTKTKSTTKNNDRFFFEFGPVVDSGFAISLELTTFARESEEQIEWAFITIKEFYL